MLIKIESDAFDATLEIPDAVIEKYCAEFRELKIRNEGQAITLVRDMAVMAINAVYAEPEVLEDEAVLNAFVKALAVKYAMDSMGLLYNS